MSYAAANSSQYDKSVNRFSPEGRLFQIEYASAAIDIGSIALGLKTKEGIILGAEKRLLSKLVIPSTVKKSLVIDDHLIFASSGLSPDATKLYNLAVNKAHNYTAIYGDKISVAGMAKYISSEMGKFADFDDENRLSRVYGCAILIGGYTDHEGFKLYFLDPAASSVSYHAKAIGSGSKTVETDLKSTYKEDMSLEEGKKMALTNLKAVMEDQMSSKNFDFTILTANGIEIATDEQKQEMINMYL